MNDLKEIVEIINSHEEIGITFHQSPDGDSLGSALALMQCLKSIGKKCFILSKDIIPSTYTFLPYASKIGDEAKEKYQGITCIVVLDCGNYERISGDVSNKEITLINIDHHLSNDKYGHYNFVDTKAAATAEIVFNMINLLNVPIDKEMAICLYTSLLTDTGGFKHSNTTERTHEIAGILTKTGFNFSEVHRIIFEETSLERLRLYSRVFDTIDLSHGSKICFMYLTKAMLTKCNIEPGDTSDIISYGVNIKEVEVAVLIKEIDSGYKISLRGKNYFDVRKIAELYGGGGHTKAAGFTVQGKNLEEIKHNLLIQIEKELI